MEAPLTLSLTTFAARLAIFRIDWNSGRLLERACAHKEG